MIGGFVLFDSRYRKNWPTKKSSKDYLGLLKRFPLGKFLKNTYFCFVQG